MVDLKRYEEIDGLKALEIFSKKQGVYDKEGAHYCADDSYLWMTINGKSGVFNLGIEAILKRKWYVKKPFDVRAEMLARPNEWVGTFRDSRNVWRKIGLDSKYMVAVETRFEEIKPNWNDDRCDMATLGELNRCIPIEDVPEEELT